MHQQVFHDEQRASAIPSPASPASLPGRLEPETEALHRNTQTATASSPRSINVGAVPAIEMCDLTKTFGGFTAVDHLCLVIAPGEIFGLLGPNGSGKTTTVNMISGLAAPTSGLVRVYGHDVRTQRHQVHRLLGSVPQENALYEELTAWQNLDFHADLYGVPRAHKRSRIEQILTLVQLRERKDSRVKIFSGGMKRRLAIGRALLHNPQLIYLDEPTLGVDVQSRRAIWDYILLLKARGRTVLITTNYLEEAQALCDRLAILDHGKLLALDTPQQLKAQYAGSVIEVETAQPSQLAHALQALSDVTGVQQQGRHFTLTTVGTSNVVARVMNVLAQEGEIVALSVREPNLDEVFLRLTGTQVRD